jgi:hypothetical protein
MIVDPGELGLALGELGPADGRLELGRVAKSILARLIYASHASTSLIVYLGPRRFTQSD